MTWNTKSQYRLKKYDHHGNQKFQTFKGHLLLNIAVTISLINC